MPPSKSLFVTESLYKEAVAIPIAAPQPTPFSFSEHPSDSSPQETSLPELDLQPSSIEDVQKDSSVCVIEVDEDDQSVTEGLIFQNTSSLSENFSCKVPCEGFCSQLFSFKELLSDQELSNDVALLYEHGFVFLSCLLEQLQWE
ncbi:hypothetical protein [Chlamydiifrater phoenicopteri]|uniref:hypothetical protein n=1 Tax=Chlamydiifrater phoenicopteri TaxID=2681469 RepID=UPI001BD19F25|nr:hypothetical protein [Chlamydiifrater phoenicopteri]